MQNYLLKSRDRKKDGVFVVEGVREVQRALESGYECNWLFFAEDQLDEAEVRTILPDTDAWLHQCSPAVFAKLAMRNGVKNLVGLFAVSDHTLADVVLPEEASILVLESIEKPGNLGAILRSASATQVDLVIVADAVVDVYNPAVIRNSLGGFFDTPIVKCSSDEAVAFLQERKIKIYTTYLEGATPHYAVDLKVAHAIVMGAEDTGVTNKWLEPADERVKIPMSGVVDSLNVSVATAVMLFESRRQREMES